MSRKRGRPARQYLILVRTVRRDTIDYEALARAALEQAAMDQEAARNRPKPEDRVKVKLKPQPKGGSR